MLLTKVIKSAQRFCARCHHQLSVGDVAKMRCPECGSGSVSIFKAKDAEVCASCDGRLSAEDIRAKRCSLCDTPLSSGEPGGGGMYKTKAGAPDAALSRDAENARRANSSSGRH